MGDAVTLVVTDDTHFKQDVTSCLEDDKFHLTFVSSFNEAKPLLKDSNNNISTIICNIPDQKETFEKDLRLFKREDFAKYIPIIGVAPANQKHSAIARNLFFHVLHTPFQEDILSHTIEEGKSDFKRYQALLSEVNSRTSAIGLIKSGKFVLQTLQQAEALTTMLSLACPDPSAVALGLSELLVNAIEHGNLEISYSEKTVLLENGKWDEEIRKRLSQDEYKDRFIEIIFKRSPEEICISITDQGPGFDWRKFIEYGADQFDNKHGRGIAIAFAMGFDNLEYNEKGNQVTAKIML